MINKTQVWCRPKQKKWKAMKTKITLGLPPNEDFFRQHLLRAN